MLEFSHKESMVCVMFGCEEIIEQKGGGWIFL